MKKGHTKYITFSDRDFSNFMFYFKLYVKIFKQITNKSNMLKGYKSLTYHESKNSLKLVQWCLNSINPESFVLYYMSAFG